MTKTVDVESLCQGICGLLEPYNKAGLQLGPETDLAADLELDSVAAMNVVMEIEDKHDIDIPINLLSEITCPLDLAKIVHQQLSKS